MKGNSAIIQTLMDESKSIVVEMAKAAKGKIYVAFKFLPLGMQSSKQTFQLKLQKTCESSPNSVLKIA